LLSTTDRMFPLGEWFVACHFINFAISGAQNIRFNLFTIEKYLNTF
jgi:hypothetical protein